jgi:CHASE2 domain-containing sensor protein
MLIGRSSSLTPLVALLLVLRFLAGLALACLGWRPRRRLGLTVEFVTPGEEVVVVGEGLAGMGFSRPLVALVLALLISIADMTTEDLEVAVDSEEATEAAEVSAKGRRVG